MPTGTALDLITRSMREAGVIGASQVPHGNQGPAGLDTMNGMFDSWNTDESFIPWRNIAAYALTNNVQAYDIGLTAAAPFNVARPIKIINANVILPSGGHMPLEVIDDDQRMDVFYPTILPPALPLKLNYRRSYPLGQLWLWFIPASGYQLELETDNLFSEFADVTVAFNFPPGYYDAAIYSLAERFCTPAWGREASPTITALAMNARLKIQSLNLDPPPLQWCNPHAFGIQRNVNGHGKTIMNDITTGRRFYR